MSLKTLKSKVEYCLERHPETSNSDIRLFNAILITFYRQYLILDDRNESMIKIMDLYKVPKQSDVQRIRAKFQNHKTNPKYLPTNSEVRKKRNILEETYRKFLGYNPEMREIIS